MLAQTFVTAVAGMLCGMSVSTVTPGEARAVSNPLDAIPIYRGAVRDTHEERTRRDDANVVVAYGDGRPALITAEAAGEERFGLLRVAEEVRIYGSDAAPSVIFDFYLSRLGGTYGQCNGDDIPNPLSLSSGRSTPMHHARCTHRWIGGTATEYRFRWYIRDAAGDLLFVQVSIEEVFGPDAEIRSRPRTYVVLTSKTFSDRAEKPAPSAEQMLGVPVYPGAVYDVNESGSTSFGSHVVDLHTFHSRDALQKVVAFYESRLNRKAMSGDDRHVFFLPDMHNSLVIRSDGAGRVSIRISRTLPPNFPAPLESEQWPRPNLGSVPAMLHTPAERNLNSRMALWGGMAGVGAIAAGWAGGMALTDSWEGAVFSAAILESFAIPYAVHVANGSRGELSLSLVAGYGVLVAAGGVLMLMGQNGSDTDLHVAAVAVPLTQLITSIVLEKRSDRSRRR
jgi:hypothetical protein